MYFSRIRIHRDFFQSARQGQVSINDSYSVHQLLWKLFADEKTRNFIYREEIAREQLGSQAGVRGEPVYYLVSSTRPISDNTFFDVQSKEYQPKLQAGDTLQFDLRTNPVVTRNGRKHDIAMNAQHNLLRSFCDNLDLHQYLPPDPKKQHYKNALIAYGGKPLDDALTEYLQGDFQYAERLQYSMTLREKLEWSLKAACDHDLKNWLVRKGKDHGFALRRDEYNQYKAQTSGYHWQSIAKKNGERKKSKKRKKVGFSSVDFTGELEVTDADKFSTALFTGIGRAKGFGCGLLLVRRI